MERELVGVRVRYAVERTVYVYAEDGSLPEARREARDPVNWVQEEPPDEILDKITIVREVR